MLGDGTRMRLAAVPASSLLLGCPAALPRLRPYQKACLFEAARDSSLRKLGQPFSKGFRTEKTLEGCFQGAYDCPRVNAEATE